jgi:hypothetical protein
MQASITAAQTAAEAATAANALNRDNFVITHRPWLSVTATPAAPIRFDASGMHVAITFFIRNVGNSPATNVWINLEIVTANVGVGDDLYSPVDRQQALINQTNARPLSTAGTIIFPNDEPHVVTWTISVDRARLDQITKKVDFVVASIVGAVDYGFVFDPAHHHTGFIFDLARSDRSRSISTLKKRAPEAIFPDEGDIPVEDVRFRRSWMVGARPS